LSARGGPVGRLAEFFRRGGYEVDVEDDVLWLRSDRVSGVVRVVGDDAGQDIAHQHGVHLMAF